MMMCVILHVWARSSQLLVTHMHMAAQVGGASLKPEFVNIIKSATTPKKA